MARIRFKKPKIAVLMSEVISLTVWLFLGQEVITALNGIIGNEYTLNLSNANNTVTNCVNGTVFEDAWNILGLASDCDTYTVGGVSSEDLSNTSNGLLGVVGLVMVVMVLMNFISYN